MEQPTEQPTEQPAEQTEEQYNSSYARLQLLENLCKEYEITHWDATRALTNFSLRKHKNLTEMRKKYKQLKDNKNIYCKHCDTSFTCQANLKNHNITRKHQRNLTKNGSPVASPAPTKVSKKK